MRLKELRGLPVIDPTAARKLGTITDYQVDPVSGRIAALDISPVDGTEGERILGHRIRRVGRHAVILTGRAGALQNVAADLNEQWLDASCLVGLEVMGDDGNRIGRLMDAGFNQDSLDIETYLLRSTSIWQRVSGRRGRIQPDKVHSCSRALMMVSTGRLKELSTTVSEGGLSPGMPLKVEDRLPAPSLDATPAGAHADGTSAPARA
jgi:sporulation protein YlmC with PRC-barrel domain